MLCSIITLQIHRNTNDRVGAHITEITSLVNRSILADLYTLSLHGLSEHKNKALRGECYSQLTK